MEPILVDDRLDPRKFSDLMNQRFSVFAGEPMATSTASGWLTMDRVMDLFGRDQRTVSFTMSRLSAPFLPAGRSWGLAFIPIGSEEGGFDELVELSLSRYSRSLTRVSSLARRCS